MLLHTLEVTAFGPFAGTERVDFDELGGTGLFLLTGSTGAGKTSVLDAVCFALFGSVPGARDQAGRLRSDHAADGAAPRVSLDLTVGGRRLRVVRTPTWHAPRKRGIGEPIKQQPTAALSQWRDGQWEPLSSRIPEVADQLQAVLGMDVHQFTQVAMLPQGAFAQFLRSGADDRKKVLERLFATQRFRDIERWLVAYRRECKTRSDMALQELRRNVDHVLGAAGDAGQLLDPGDPLSWPQQVASVRADLEADHAQAQAHQQRAETAMAVATRALDEARRVRSLQTRAATARDHVADLDASQQQADAEALRLDAAERSVTVVAHLERLDYAAESVAAQRHSLDAAVARARRLGVEVADASDDRSVQLAFAEHVCRTGQKLVDGAEQLCQLHDEHRAAAAVLVRLRAESTEASAAWAQARENVEAAPATRRMLERRVAEAREAAAQEIHWAARLEQVRVIHDAAAALPQALMGRAAATVERDQAFARLNDANAALNALVAARLESSAAWLATRLRAGDPCQVCGSVEHPAPHRVASETVSERDEQRARAEAERLAHAKQDAEERMTLAREQVARLESISAQRTLADVESDRASLAAGLNAAQSAAADLVRLEAQLEELDTLLRRAQSGLDASAERASQLAERLVGLQAQDDDRVAQLVETVGPGLDVDRYVSRVNRSDKAARAVVASLRALQSAEQELAKAERAARRSLRAVGFESLGEVRAAVLDRAAVATLRESAHQRDDRRRRAREELAEPDVARAASLEPPDLDRLELSLATARSHAAAAVQARSVLGSRLADVTRLADDVANASAAWAPLREEAAVAESMASLAEGQSADNVPRVSLSAYVLAARLQQVVDAANERFVPMTSGRYMLEHTMERSAGDRRGGSGGLGLLVCDQWTGEARDPKTLSGGETFQASLALALGLSDVVTHEVGGVQMHTLFVDEGFGSLDADSLDEVMDVLDCLRAGGRRVGVVSHVDTMRERIPSQVRLVKTPTGSRIEQHT